MDKRVKPVLVARSSMPPLEEYVEMLKPLWENAWLTNMGEYHEHLKSELRNYLGVPQLELFVNGHLALEMAIQAMALEGEVITTPFTFASTAHAIVRNGLKPVFCDIREDNYTIDAEQLESLITERTSAILPVHVYGHVCDVERIQEIADKHRLKVIYDAAHTFGETYKGRGVGTYGDAAMFSFHATKVFHTIEGGAITFKESWIGDILYKLKNFGITGYESVEYVGANAKMNEFQAAMGLCNLRYVKDEIAKRGAVAARYRERLEGVPGLRLGIVDPDTTPNYAYFPVRFDGFRKNREQVFAELAEHGIHARKYFYPCANAYECYQGEYHESDTPTAARISKEILTLPLYADLPLTVVDEICALILK